MVLHTPEKIIEYMTKAKKLPNGQRQVIKELKEKGEPVSAPKIANRAAEFREVSLAEAFFRIDSSLRLCESNLPVVFVNTNFPEDRSLHYVKVNKDGIRMPGRSGQFIAAKGILEKYSQK